MRHRYFELRTKEGDDSIEGGNMWSHHICYTIEGNPDESPMVLGDWTLAPAH